MTTPNAFVILICSVCGKRVNVETSKTDEEGRAVHEECYAEKVRQVRSAFRGLFRAPTRIYPSDRSIDRSLALVLRRGGVILYPAACCVRVWLCPFPLGRPA